IKSPTNMIYNDRVTLFEITATDESEIDSIWYSWHGTNVTYLTPYYITFDEGINTIHAWANDSAGNLASALVTFSVDTTNPTIEIVHPTTTFYGDSTQLLDLSISDDIAIDQIWFNWNGENVLYTSPTNVTFADGPITVHVYANDTAGNTFHYSVNFTIADVFTTIWDPTMTSIFSTTVNKIALPLQSTGAYDFWVLWGDGTSDHITSWNQSEVIHSYSTLGLFEVKIIGTITEWGFFNNGDKVKIMEIKRWGSVQLGISSSVFAGCENLVITATDPIPFEGRTNYRGLFMSCTQLTTIPNLESLDTSNVTDMSLMFAGATNFNQELHDWNVSKVTTMQQMFFTAETFNFSLNSWDVSSVTDMSNMFAYAYGFNQPLNDWDTSSVVNMEHMFEFAVYFNQPLNDWNTSSAVNMENMFEYAVYFNQSLSSWDVSNVETMREMFKEASNFNQPLSKWNVSDVTDMYGMFNRADNFDQDLGAWNVSSVTTMQYMFWEITLSTPNYDNLLIGWSSLSVQSLVSFSAGYSQYSSGAAADARNVLDITYEWYISDGGLAS
ncbi:MAG: BspA family leucine-rich repeat surface protein, partial [Promethearchaeota archaeon]